MQKTITLLCAECGEKATYKIGADKSMATLNDIAAFMEESKERNKLLEWMVKTANTQPDERLPALFGNQVETLCNVNYQALGAKVRLMDPSTDADAAVQRYKTSDAIEKVNISKAKWLEALKRDGIVAFYAMFYCKKCKKLENRVYLRIHVSGTKEYLYVYPHKCDTCKNDLELVDEDNIGFIHTGLPTTVPCKCGKPLIVDSVNFTQEKKA